MHGKAQLEPARHSVVLDCELVQLHIHVPKFACCLLYYAHAVRLAVSPNAKI